MLRCGDGCWDSDGVWRGEDGDEGRHTCRDKSNKILPLNSSQQCGGLECKQGEVTVCLDRAVECDLHPNCEGGEDEENCDEAYRAKKLVSDSALYRCDSPHHNPGTSTATVQILATRCDGREECYQGLDELYCDIASHWSVKVAAGQTGETSWGWSGHSSDLGYRKIECTGGFSLLLLQRAVGLQP